MPVKYLKVNKKHAKGHSWLPKFFTSKGVVKTQGEEAVKPKFMAKNKAEGEKHKSKKIWWFSFIVSLFFVAGLLTYFDIPTKLFNSPLFTKGGARLVVNTEFTPALVYLNNRQLGATPLDIRGVRAGDYQLELQATKDQDFFTKLTIPVKLQNNITTVVKAQIGPTLRTSSYAVLYYDQIKGTKLLVNAKQEDVSVFIDDKEVGKTPVLVKDLPDGNHKISFKKQGFRPMDFDIVIRNDQTLVIDVKLYEYVLNAN